MRPKTNSYPDDRGSTEYSVINQPLVQDKIADECVESVAAELGLTENLVRKIHDFQWETVKKATEEYKTVYVSGFFKLRFRTKMVKQYINRLKRQQLKLAIQHGQAEGEKRWKIGWDIGQIGEEIKLLSKQLEKHSK